MEESQFIGLQWTQIVWDLTIFQIACKMDQRGRRPQDLVPHCLFGALPCQPKIPIIHHHCHYFNCYEYVPVGSKVPQWHEMLLHLILAYIVTPVPNASSTWRRRTWACRKPFLSIVKKYQWDNQRKCWQHGFHQSLCRCNWPSLKWLHWHACIEECQWNLQSHHCNDLDQIFIHNQQPILSWTCKDLISSFT